MEFVKSLLFIPCTKILPGGAKLVEPLLGVGWTLSFEMLFYISLSAGLFISRRRAVWIGAAIVLSVLLASFLFATSSDIAGFFARSVMFEFIFGILAYYFCKAVTPMTARRFRIPALALCVACATSLICFEGLLHQANLVSLPRALLFGLPSWLLVIGATTLSKAGWDTNIASIVLVGDASYVLYLLQFFSLYGIDRILAVRWSWLKISTPSGAIVGISASILAAVAFHLAAERPTLNRLLRRFGGNRPATELAPVS
jgi:peptidoglycan/LPS O-acetylase OafA/YrhL